MYWPPRKSLEEAGVASANGKKKYRILRTLAEYMKANLGLSKISKRNL